MTDYCFVIPTNLQVNEYDFWRNRILKEASKPSGITTQSLLIILVREQRDLQGSYKIA